MALRLLRLLPLLLLAACSSSINNRPSAPGTSTPGNSLHGSVFGGTQPVTNAKIQLFAAGTTGSSSPSTPLLNPAATTDSNGNFTIGTYTCPSVDSLVFITGTGGNPGTTTGTNNSALVLMTALGRCGDLPANASVVLNEVTTVAAASALAPFATSASSIGSSVSDIPNLAAAFVQAGKFANTSTGSAPGAAVAAGTLVPVEMINTVANILASCVNSAGGVAGDRSNCGILFSLSDPNGTAPATDTMMAVLHIVTFSRLNISDLFNRMPVPPPFQPMLTAAPDSFAVAFSVTSGLRSSQTNMTFATPAAGTESTQTLTLTNTLQTSIALSSFNITGLNGADFSQANSCPASLSPGTACTISVKFAPAATGNRIASLFIRNNSPNSTLIIPLSGIVVPPTSVPQIVSVSPNSTTAGSPNTIVTVTGSNFTSSSTILINGLEQPTTYISSQSLSFTLTASQLSSPGSLAICVRNGGYQSSLYSFSVTNPVPTLNSISPAAITSGSPRFTLTVSGTGISSGSSVLINGVAHPVTASGTTYTISVESSEVTSVGDLGVTVVNPAPGGGTSAALTLHVIATGNRLRTLDYPTNDIVQDEVNHLLYASIPSSSSTSPNSIIAIDPLQGVVVTTRAMTGQPTKLAIADDASYLYVSLPATGEISRLQLPSLTPDIQWSLKNSSGAGFSAEDMAVAPGQPHTLAVTGSSLNIYDDSVRRSLSPAPGYPLPTFDTIAWGGDAATLYATSAVTSGGPEYIFSVDQNGPTLTKTINSVFGDFPRRLVYDKTTSRIYDGYGRVADPATGTLAGQFNVHNTLTYVTNPFAIDSAHSKAFFLNTSAFSSPLGIDIQAFDLTSFAYVNAITTPNLSGSKIVPWGSSGVAVGGGTKIFLIDGSFVSSTGTSSQTGSYIEVSPTLDTISPQTVTAGSGPVDITLNGRDFSESSVVTWNGQALSISSQTTTQIIATIPASLLTTPITTSVTVSNGAGTENSGGVSFAVLPNLGPNLQISAISVSGQDMTWDSTRGRLYVAMTDGATISGGSIGVVDPATTTLSNVVPTGGNPASLGLSDDGHYLYAGFQTTNFVKRFSLPDFSLDLTIPLNSGSLTTSHAEDVKVAPGNPHTVAISMGSNQITPRGAGGLAVFDDAVPRSAKLTTDVYKVAWGKDSTHLFAQSDPNISSQSLYILSADSNGVVQQAISGFVTNLGLGPHYDSATNLIYGDGGRVSDPTDASAAGVFQARGLMVADSGLNRAFFLRLNTTNPLAWMYELDIFDLTRQTLLKTIPIPAVSGYPTQFVRWGNQGLAFLTYGQAYSNTTGMLYILQGSDITGIDTPPSGSITLSPASVVAGASAQATITVNGTGFQQTSTILVNGAAQPTTYISPSQLSFQISAADQSFANYLAVVVTDPATGISSPATSLSVNNPVPLISSLSNAKLPVNSANTQVTLSGTGFVPTTTVLFNGIARSTTYIASNQISVLLPYSDLGTAGNYSLTAVNPAPGGGTAATVLEVDNPLPSITSVSPTTVLTGSPAKTILVYGTGFVSGTQILVNGTPRSTTYSTPANVSASLTAADFASQGSLSIVAANPTPGGGSSAAASIAVNNGLPGPITLSPSTVTQGTSTPTRITVTGSNFTSSAYVLINNSQRPTTYISSTQLNFALTVADQASVATKIVTVVNPPPNGGSSSAFLNIAAATATPVISAVYPTQFVAGTTDTFLSVTGTGFNTSSVVRWNGDPLVTYNGGSNNLSAPVPSSLLANPGTATITVETATSTPSISNAVSVSIVLPAAPTVSSISPVYGPIHTGFTGTIAGSNFTSNSTVTFNGETVPSTFVSSTQLTATIPDSAVIPGNNNIAVTTPAPGGGTSGSLVYTAYIPIANNSMVYNPVDHLFYLSVPGSAEAPYANSVVSLDPLTGTLGTPILVGSEPNHLALSSDGKSIWVGLDGASAVRKVDLVSHTAGLQFSLPNPESNSGPALKALALAAVPGQTNSVIVSAANGQPFDTLLAIYDSGVPRSFVSPFYASLITVDGSKNEVYVAQNGGYQTYTYDSYGLRPLGTGHPDSTVAFGYDDRLQLSVGRIYTDTGKILDAETAATIGTFSPTTSSPVSTTIDPTLGLAFILDSSAQYALPNRIQLFNLSDFTPSGPNSIPVNLASTNGISPDTPLSKLTRWGSNGLAFRDGDRVYALRSNLVKDLTGSPADLGVTLSVSGATSTGAQTIYTATITNVGPQPASELVLSGLAPSTGVLASSTSASGTCAIATNVTCNLGSLAAGASASAVFTVSQLTPGSSTLTVQVTASQADPDSTNNQASSTTTITGPVYSPAPTATSISPSAVLAGSGDTAVTVSGNGFTTGSTVMVDGAPLLTTVTGTSELSAVIPASSVSTLGWHLITVSNPVPGGGLSSAVPLTIYSKIKAGANHIVYDPFSRRIIASLASAQPLGNSIVTLAPETGDLDTPSLVGSEPTRMELSDDGNLLYVLASGEDQLVRYNMRTRQPEFSFKLPTNSGTYSTSTTLFAIQPGSENTLAVNTPNGPAGEIVDFDPLNKQAMARPSTLTFADVGGEPRFLDASTLIFASQLSRYTVTPSGLGSRISSIPVVASAFKIARGIAYTDQGSIVDVTSSSAKNLGTLVAQHIYYPSQSDNFAPDPIIGRVFFNAAFSNGTYDIQGGAGVAAFDTNTLKAVNYTPFAIDSSADGTPIKGVDIVRWGQDGLASLNSSGTIYLMRGPAVLPQLLGTSTPPVLAGTPQAIQHGSGNTVLTLIGNNFLPGVAAFWNGSYRTTTLVDSTHITIDIPYTDLLSSGSAAITCSNPGSTTSGPVAIEVN